VHSAWARAAGGEIHKDNELSWIRTEIPYAYFNLVAKIHLRPENVDKRITETLALFESRDIPMEWWVGPSTQPSDFGKRLESYGLKKWKDEYALAVELDSVDEDTLESSELEIKKIEDSESLKQWVLTAAIAHYLRSFVSGDGGCKAANSGFFAGIRKSGCAGEGRG
jgi:hypothetical protein